MKKTTSFPLSILFCKWTNICENGIDHGFLQLNHNVDYITHPFESVDYDQEYLNILAEKLLNTHYDCVFSVNFIPIISRVCNLFKTPYICWTSDSPCFQLFSDAIKNPWNRIFLFDRSQYQKFRSLNPSCIYYMPLGCDYPLWNSIKLTDQEYSYYKCDVSFIGSTYEEKCKYNLIDNLPDYISGYVDALIQAQIHVYGYNFIEDSLSDNFCQEFKKAVDWYPLGQDYTEDVKAIIADTYIGHKCTEQERLLTLKNISEHYQLDLYTLSNTSRLPKAHHRGAADSFTMMPKIFKCSKINLNMTSRTIKTGVPLRIFDVMGAGGFLLTNYQSEIPDLFKIGRDLAVYESQDDLIQQISYYLKHDDIRQSIAANGQEQIRKYHTFKNRLEQILEIGLKTQ